MHNVRLSRREFLSRTGKAAGLAALTSTAGLALHVRDPRPFDEDETKPLVRDLRIAGLAPRLAVVHGEDPALLARASIEKLGGMGTFIKRGDVVVVKPNIGWDRMPEQAANTNPAVVREIIQLCLAAGAAKVIVTDVTCNETERCFQRSGIARAAEEAGAEVRRPRESDFTEVNTGGVMLGKQPVLKSFLEADKVINVPIAKHHSLTGTTLALKNLYGIISGNRSRLHQDIHNSLADLGNFLRPTLTVVDAFRILRRNGPQGGNLADVEYTKTLVACADTVAADAYAAETFFGLTSDRLNYLGFAQERGLGTADYRTLPIDEFTV